MTTSILISAAVAIVGVLAVIAWQLQSRVNEMERRRRSQALEVEEQKQQHRHYMNNSIQILAQGVVDDQVTMTEAAIRISVLMDNLDITHEHREEFSAFFQLADATAHIPILDAWKQLPKKEKFRYDKERLEAEARFKDFIIDAATRIKGRKF